jgi:hypothetical protein
MSRVIEIRFVGYGVPDLAAEKTFYLDQWKLVEAGEKDGLAHFAADGDEELNVVRLRSSGDMMAGISRLKQAGTDIRWGPGRHTAGNNTFSYFTTPAGFTVEYTSELEHVDFETHEAKLHIPGPKVIDQWGIGVGGPQTMPHPAPDAGLFQPAEV